MIQISNTMKKRNPFLVNICIELGGQITENLENADIIFDRLRKHSKYLKNQMQTFVSENKNIF